jgi:hypothetical protein
MIGMNADFDEKPEDVGKQIKSHGVNWRQGMMREDSPLLEDYEISGYPTKIVIGKDGKVLLIDNFVTKKQLEELINSQ